MKKNHFRENNVPYLDYKDVVTLKKFLTPHARIQSRRRSGASAEFQRELSQAVKRARFMGLLPYVTK